MSDAKVRGVVHLIEETKTYGQKGFRKRMVVLEQDKGSFTNYVPVEFTRDACDSVDEMKKGDEVEVTYRLNGRRWQKDANSEVKFFVNVEAMSFEVVGGSPSSSGSANDAFAEAGGEEDDAPF
ncbi:MULTISPECIES: DUF3127 domain-containing protein [Pirellulaceae]|uniref:Single-stranded DNA-binding protein n=1 Tax=Aporhodopirellula rubra TaxID=980271 RepID=A0A7W5H3F9_9BACT|nr:MULTISPECIES: DUF3127 domain-containing protein [Pirellulaceae]MBB3204264.1 single-stranded DNA-binding protein [Aporhodopirellula rubra]